MLSKISFKKDFRCFKAGTAFDFRPGINFIVGDQGVGKSSLLFLIRKMGGDTRVAGALNAKEAAKIADVTMTANKPFKFFGFDFEKENPRTINHLEDKGMLFQIGSAFRSHGQTVRGILASLEESAAQEPHLVLFDEPDAGLSPRSVVDLLNVMKTVVDKGGQVIASVHNPILMVGVPEVFSLEHGRWMTGRDFLAAHGVIETP